MIGRCLLLLLISYESLAQTYVGPTYQAMGSTGIALKGIYSLTANPAGLVGMERPTAGVSYQQHFMSADITTQVALLGVPTRLGAFGVAVSRYGMNKAYEDTKAGFSFAKQFGSELAFGMSVSYHQFYIPAYLRVSSLSVDIGVQYRTAQGAIFGLQCTNVGRTDLGSDISGNLPVFVGVGASYPLAAVLVTADVQYRWQQAIGGHFGVEYNLMEPLYLRGGISVNPMLQHAGFGIRLRSFSFDTAATFHPRLGMSPQIGICYAF